MSPERNREESLARLARELLAPEWPSADLLVRYVDDPDSLTPEERRSFMAALESSPELQAQVRVLQTTNLTELMARVDAPDAGRRLPGRSAPPPRGASRSGSYRVAPSSGSRGARSSAG